MITDRLGLIEPVVNMHKVKYVILDKLIKDKKIECNHVNMYINLDCVFEMFYKHKNIEAFGSLKGKETISLSANIINLISHYRHYFWSRRGITSSFYIYSQNSAVTNSNIPEYKSDMMYMKDVNNLKYGAINDIIQGNSSIIQTIADYVEDAYYIPSLDMESSLIPAYIITNIAKKNDINIILTSDKAEYQLVSEKTFILRAVSNRSKLLGTQDIISSKFKDTKYKPSVELDSGLYPLFMSLEGYKKRNVPKVSGYTPAKISKTLTKAIENGDIDNGYIKSTYSIMDIFEFDGDDFDDFANNYKTIDFRRGLRNMPDICITRIKNALVNRYNIDALMFINQHYFEYNNLELIELCKGVRDR